MRHVSLALTAGALALAIAPAARADITSKSEAGFVSRNAVEVSATPEAVWTVLTTPSGWWNSEHTFSGDAKNLTLNPVAGGCFCEKLPPPAGSASRTAMGGVEHMRVVNVQPGKVLRMTGALGPLQSEAVNGVLTITLKPGATGTRILFEYVVGGYMHYKIDDIAPAVDTVMKDQLAGLALKVDPGLAAKAGPAPASSSAAAPIKPKAKPAAKPAATTAPLSRDDDADQARGAEAAAAMAAMSTAPVAPPTRTSRPGAGASGYVTRSFLVRRPAPGSFVLVDEADPGTVIPAQFTGKAIIDRFAAGWGVGTSAANRGKSVVCSCTGRFTESAGKTVFSVIDAAFSYE